MNYKEYITSKEWRDKHKGFLQQAGYRCAFSGLKLKRYNCHHTHYSNLGDEVYGRDIVCLHPWFHRWVIHGILCGFKRPSQQQAYPNTPQRIAHVWCLLPWFCKAIALISLLSTPIALSLQPQSPERGLSVWANSGQFINQAAEKLVQRGRNF